MSAGHAYRIERRAAKKAGLVGRYGTAGKALAALRAMKPKRGKTAEGEFDLYQGDIKVLTMDRHGRDYGAWA